MFFLSLERNVEAADTLHMYVVNGGFDGNS